MLTWKDGTLTEKATQSPFAEACAALERVERPLTPRERHAAVGRSIAASHGITYDQMIGHGRSAQVVDARMEFCRYLHEKGLSQTQIGNALNRERSVISYMLNRADQLPRRRARNAARRANDTDN